MPGEYGEVTTTEAGRAGRDGKPSVCILLYNYRDIVINRFFIEHKEDTDAKPDRRERRRRMKTAALSREGKRRRLAVMQHYVSRRTCLRAFMLRYFGEHAPDTCGACSVCCAMTFASDELHPLLFDTEDKDLYTELRALRLRLSREKHKTPCKIFPDPVLHDMARVRPQHLWSLLFMEGAGVKNTLLYGKPFTAAIRLWCETHGT